MQPLEQVLASLACGSIFMFFSELLFWARLRPGDSLPGWLGTWMLYSAMAFVFLSLVARFRIRSIWALFLAGAVFGWLTEGLIVQTAYESLPLSLSFTGLAWHALLTVWVGWYALRRALARSLRSVVLTASVIGLAYGLWSISWWVQPDGGVMEPLDFAAYTFGASLPVVCAYWLFARTGAAMKAPGRLSGWIAAGLLLIYFVFITIPAAPWAALILPLLLALVWLTLRHNRQVESGASLLDELPGSVPPWRYAGLLALPLSAAVLYSLAFMLGLRWQTHWLLYLLTTPAGFILFIVSLVKVWRRKRAGDLFQA